MGSGLKEELKGQVLKKNTFRWLFLSIAIQKNNMFYQDLTLIRNDPNNEAKGKTHCHKNSSIAEYD